MKFAKPNLFTSRTNNTNTARTPQLNTTTRKEKTMLHAPFNSNLMRTNKQKIYSPANAPRMTVKRQQRTRKQEGEEGNKRQMKKEQNRGGVVNRLRVNAAPLNQYTKYLDDSQNIFYQQSSQFRRLKIVKTAKNYLTFLLLCLVFSYFMTGRIVAFPKQRCPKHADCDVFIHCHQGYILQNEDCIIDPAIIHQAQLISIATIEQLSYDYGNADCSYPNSSLAATVPEKRMRHVFRQFQIEEEILRQEVINYFMSRQNQMSQHFAYNLSTIIPLNKKYSLSCSFKLFSRTNNFLYLLIALLSSIFLLAFAIRRQLAVSQARRVYNLLSDKVQRCGQLDIGEQRSLLVGVRWSESLWRVVDAMRCGQGRIGYYIDAQRLHWCKLPGVVV